MKSKNGERGWEASDKVVGRGRSECSQARPSECSQATPKSAGIRGAGFEHASLDGARERCTATAPFMFSHAQVLIYVVGHSAPFPAVAHPINNEHEQRDWIFQISTRRSRRGACSCAASPPTVCPAAAVRRQGAHPSHPRRQWPSKEACLQPPPPA